MNIVVLALLSLALLLQIIALFLVAEVDLETDETAPGTYTIEAKFRPSRFGLMLVVVGVILATVGSGLSLWAPGF